MQFKKEDKYEKYDDQQINGTEAVQSPQTQFINKLCESMRYGDLDKVNDLEQSIINQGATISTLLAKTALEFDPDQLEDDHPGEKFEVARTTLGLIGKIGELDEQSVELLFERFIRGRNGGEASKNQWGGVWGTAVDTLQKLGYKVVE